MILPRTIFNKLLLQKNKPQISILIGARQVGKSTLMDLLQNAIDEPSTYLNLENPEDLKIFRDGYTSFINEIDTKLVFIDEFYYYSNISSVFKAVYDLNKDIKIYASGSSSIEIHKYLKESMAGRKTENKIYPLSFGEWVNKYGLSLPKIFSDFKIKKHAEYIKKLNCFVKYGTMPGIIELDDEVEIIEYLHEIYKAYILKDVKSLIKEESILSFNKLTELLVLNNSCMLNVNRFRANLNLKTEQVNKHLDIMDNTYVVKQISPLFTNKSKEIKKMPKTYFYDSGIANSIMKDFRDIELRQDKGAIIETFVLWEIEKSLDIRFSLNYWRTRDGQEVDFVISKNKEYLPIEVKQRWDKIMVPTGMKAFFVRYPDTKYGIILTRDEVNEYKFGDKTIYVMPWYFASQLSSIL